MSSLLDLISSREEAFRSPTRLASLYSDFRSQRSSNPDGYAANSQAWLKALLAAAEAKQLPGQSDTFIIPTGPELARALQTARYGQPLALQAVLEDAIKDKRLIPVPEFLAAKTSIYEKSWITSPWQLVGWVLSRVGTPLRSRTQAGTNLVALQSLEALADHIQIEVDQTTSSNVSRIYSRQLFLDHFRHLTGDISTTSPGLKVLLTFLSRDRQLITYDEVRDTIKFRPTTGQKPMPITNEDVDIASLRALISSLEDQVRKIEEEVAKLDSGVREAIIAKNTVAAKRHLRQKKMAESTLDQRQTTLYQLSDVYAKIEQAADQVEIVKVMQAAGRTLKSLNSAAGDVEDIREIMDDLRDSMADTDDIANALNDPAIIVNDAEVEDELEMLEQQEREQNANKQRQAEAAKQEAEAEQTRKRLEELTIPSDPIGEPSVPSVAAAEKTAAST